MEFYKSDHKLEHRYQKTIRYKDCLFEYIQKQERLGLKCKSSMEKIAIAYKTKIIQVESKMDHFLTSITNVQYKTYDQLTKYFLTKAYFKRKSTMPFSYIDFIIERMKQVFIPSLLMQNGVHYIVALMGGGKSSLLYHTIEKLRVKRGLGAYVNVDIEHPHYDPLKGIDVVYHKRFEADDYWGAVTDEQTEKVTFTQLKSFNKMFPVLVLDEWLSKMNHRMNNTSDYKKMFIPFIKSLAHMRHQGINHVYVASQLDTTDTQLMSMFKYMHEVEIDLDVSYLDWVESGKLSKHIKGWKIYTYVVKRKKGKSDKVLYKKWYEPCTMDMTNFNSLNQASEYKNLPYDKIKFERSTF
jgi:hypothetical protein